MRPDITRFKPELFDNPDKACKRVQEIYAENTKHLRESFQAYAAGKDIGGHVSAGYPYVALTTDKTDHIDTSMRSYGFISGPGRYRTTLTRPDVFADYYREQFALLLSNHRVPLEVGVSNVPIPVHFAFPDGVHVEGDLMPERIEALRDAFDLPGLDMMNDNIANGIYQQDADGYYPLALFTAPRADYSLHRLRHYTATGPEHFQNFVIFTNYQFYVDEFVRHALDTMRASDDVETAARRKQYKCFVEPGGHVTWNANLTQDKPTGSRLERLPQMPAYHLVCDDHCGITMINIGVGPSNAKTITDHVAVLRPHAWIMLGHCAGLRDAQKLGDYVLAHAYVRDDHILDSELPVWVPLPALAEIQRALEQAVAHVTGTSGKALKSVMRTGTVVTTDNRNWELLGYQKMVEQFSQSRAIALDMESSVIAANGFRFRVPYGTLLCVSDKPMHGEIKLPGMANKFYKQQVDQHLQIGLKSIELLRAGGREALHSRKLRGFVETAFQ
ncbi:MAG: AMP nucleosidase [Alphaproteobacteria bacterium]|nr:AMP nucleosidase [Alphaproteobacteria bacterium]